MWNIDYDNNVTEVNCFNETKIYFGELTETGLIKYTKEWRAKRNNNAAIFIEDDNVSLENMELLINDRYSNSLIKTKLIKLPKNEFVNENKEQIRYISESSINIKTLNGYTGDLEIILPELNLSTKVFVENSLKENPVEDSEIINILKEGFTDKLAEILAQSPNESESYGISEDDIESEFDTEYDPEEYNEYSENDGEVLNDDTVESYIDRSISMPTTEDFYSIDEFPTLGEDKEYDEEVVKDEIEDKIRYIANTFIEAPNVSINISEFEEQPNKITGNIIIEKLNNKYIATISGIGFRNFKMLDNDDNHCFVFEDTPSMFLNKIKKRLKNMYSMTEEDLSKLKVVMILDKQLEIYDESITVIPREEAIRLVSESGINTIVIENKNIKVSFVENKARRIKLSANLSGTLGLRGFIEELVYTLNTDVKVFEKESNEFECLTDLLL